MASCLSTIITGDRTQAGKIEQLFVSLRNGPNKHLFKCPGKTPLAREIEDVEYLNTTDLRLFARHCRLNIYVYYDPEGGEQPCYLKLAGKHKGVQNGGIFLKFQVVEDVQHCLLIYRCELKSTSG